LICEALRRTTVSIRTGGEFEGTGSGVALNNNLVVTNAHVVHGSEVHVESWEGRVAQARVLKVDRGRDLALLEAEDLRAEPAQLGDSDVARPGLPVVAIGNPLGFIGAMSSGIVHSAFAGNGYRWLCADIRLAPGNSGGPLANFSGQVLGINTMVASGGLALAVPSRSVQAFVQSGHSRRPIGVTLRPVSGGILVLELLPNGPAEQASLRPGDLLVSVNEKPLRFVEDLQVAANESETITLDFRRGGESQLRRVVVQVPRRSSARAA
jgi:serine protease Do